MSGCFGGSFEDRYRERELNRWLDSQEPEELNEDGEPIQPSEPDWDAIAEARDEARERRLNR
jgi:hypothetical protein